MPVIRPASAWTVPRFSLTSSILPTSLDFRSRVYASGTEIGEYVAPSVPAYQ
jgi:hypothetical protein